MPDKIPAKTAFTDDEKRISTLDAYYLHSPGFLDLDRFTRLAIAIYNAPGAFIAFFGKETVSYASAIGFGGIETETFDESPFSRVLTKKTTLIIENPEENISFRKSILAKNGFVAFALAPIKTPDGQILGCLGIAAKEKIKSSETDLTALELLAELVAGKLDDNRSNRRAIEIQTEFMNRVVHDLNNYLGNLMLASSMFQDVELDEQYRDLPEMLLRNTNRITDKLKHTQQLIKIEGTAFKLKPEAVNCAAILDEICESYEALLQKRNINLEKKFASEIGITGDPRMLYELFDNLISNAIKFSPDNSTIRIGYTDREDHFEFTISDTGQGLMAEEIERIFMRYTSLSPVPAVGMPSRGIGLWLARAIVDMHRGNIEAVSDGKGKGLMMKVTLPKNR